MAPSGEIPEEEVREGTTQRGGKTKTEKTVKIGQP